MTFATQLAAAFTPIGGVYDDASITQALSWAQSFVEGYCNRTFDLTTDDVAYVDPFYSMAALPDYPVVSVSSVVSLPTQTTLTNYAFVAETGLIYATSCDPSWPTRPGSLQVTYTHGFTTVPSGLVNAACRFAQQYLENPALLLQREVGSFNERYAGNTGGIGIVINAFDERILDRYTRISAA